MLMRLSDAGSELDTLFAATSTCSHLSTDQESQYRKLGTGSL
jgi:hypothetical protein